jgi:hypothetical protein
MSDEKYLKKFSLLSMSQIAMMVEPIDQAGETEAVLSPLP